MSFVEPCPECARLRAVLAMIVEAQALIDSSYGPCCHQGYDARARAKGLALYWQAIEEARDLLEGGGS